MTDRTDIDRWADDGGPDEHGWQEMAGPADSAVGDADAPTGDEVLLAALAGGATRREAAAAAGLSERTVYRRLADADFARQVREARGQLLDEALGALTAGGVQAARVLQKLLTNKNRNLRFRAATELLKLLVKIREHAELADRMAELERRLAEQDSQKGGRR